MIICKTREEQEFLHLNDCEIKKLIEIRVINTYKNKYPNAKRYSLKFKNK